jgi:hypothetical protein
MAKSIIAIDVDDEKFKNFKKNFDLYQSALKELPKDWKNANQAVGQHAEDVNKFISKLEKQQKDLNKSMSDGNEVLKHTAKITGQISLNFASTALSIAKWLTLGAIGSGFGLGALAAATTNTKKSASGIGISSGELRAANVNYGNYISPESVLSKIADVQSDLTRRQILTRLGGQPGQNAAQMLPELFKNAIKEFKQGGESSKYADVMGLTQIFDMTDLRRGIKLTEEQLNDAAIAFQKDIKALTLSGSDEEIMGNFLNQLKRSGESLEVNLVKALSPLTPAMEQLANAVSLSITNFLATDAVKKSMQDFTAWINSEESKRSIKAFINGIEVIGQIMFKIGEVLGTVFGSVGRQIGNEAGFLDTYALNPIGKAIGNSAGFVSTHISKFLDFMGKEMHSEIVDANRHETPIQSPYINEINAGSIPERMNNPGDLRSWKGVPTENGFAHFKSNEDGIRAMAEQLRLYQNRDHLSTIREIISKWSPSSENDTEKSIANITKISGFKSDQQLNLNDSATMEKLIYAITKRENERSNFTPEIVHRIIVNNSSGSDLVVSANTMK